MLFYINDGAKKVAVFGPKIVDFLLAGLRPRTPLGLSPQTPAGAPAPDPVYILRAKLEAS